MNPKILIGTIFNEEYWFCLPFLLDYLIEEKALYSDVDLLVVLNNTPKASKEKFDELAKQYDFIKIHEAGLIPNPRPGRINEHAIVACRNIIFDYATDGGYDGMMFEDFDTIPSYGALHKMVPYMTWPKVAMVGGNYHYKGVQSVVGGPVIVGKFPVDSIEFEKEITQKDAEWTDKVMALGFGFTLITREIFSNPKYKLDTDFLIEHPSGTEDIPLCNKIRADGYKFIWLKNVRARHLSKNKEKNRVEAW
jgi:cellulose synthase/poly-beta-1,6-N-acetylglucosamine synthase-like glycosyltransferase